jgi:hypothetical protein
MMTRCSAPIALLRQQLDRKDSSERPIRPFPSGTGITSPHDPARESVLQEPTLAGTPAEDPVCLATLKNHRSLMPMGQEARKPIFLLTLADGAIGSHARAVVEARKDSRRLAEKLLEEMKVMST